MASYLHYVVLFAAPLFLYALLFLVVVTLYILRPYINSNYFTKTTCKVIDIQESISIASCNGGTDPFSSCLKVSSIHF